MLDAYVSVPLREASTWVSYIFLKLSSFPIDKQGTLLSTPRMTFDVIPACSGSTTLRVMLFVGIVWSAMQEKMNLTRKILMVVFVVPIALVANALRLCALVVMGHLLNKPVEGTLHDLTGMAAFVLAFGALLIVSALMQNKDDQANQGSPLTPRVIGLVTCTLLVFIPLGSWSYAGWHSSPLDRMGYIYLIIAIAGIAYSWRKIPRQNSNLALGIGSTVTGFILLIISTVAEINILSAVSFLFFALGYFFLIHGTRLSLICLPLGALAFLSMPTTTFQINKVLLTIGMHAEKNTGIYLKIGIGIFLIALWFVALWKFNKNEITKEKPVISLRSLEVIIAVLVVSLALKTSYANTTKVSENPGTVKLSYILGDWLGIKANTSNDSNTYKKFQDAWIRHYIKDDQRVEIIITASGGDRHQLHPPEYCLTGAGWFLNEESRCELNILGDKLSQVSKMNLSKNDEKRYFLHWFTDGETVLSDYKSMLTEDTLRRFKGKQTKWFLFRLIATSEEALHDDFLEHFHGKIIVDEKTYNF